jgi:hypothetical protein
MGWLALKAILGLSIGTVAAFGAGAPIGILLPRGFRRFERIAFVILGGFGILSTALFLVGQLFFTKRSVLFLLAVAIGLAIVLFRSVIPREAPVSSEGRKIPRIPAIILGSVLLFTAVSGLAEITGDWNTTLLLTICLDQRFGSGTASSVPCSTIPIPHFLRSLRLSSQLYGVLGAAGPPISQVS